MRLIDADEIRYSTETIGDESGSMAEFPVAYKEDIDRMPTVDAEPVVHAKWIILKDLDLCECSRCGWRELHYEDSPDPSEAYPYCHCGAKMTGTDSTDGSNEEEK